MRGGEVKPDGARRRSPILKRCACGAMRAHAESAMVQTRIKPYLEQVAAEEQRAAQRRAFLRNQMLGMVLLALAVLAWWLLHANARWIFPPGWWRL